MKKNLSWLWLVSVGLAVSGLVGTSADCAEGEILYNGIMLPKSWPPVIPALTRAPMPLPYLQAPPEVIPIDLGRQLFVDDFLIEEKTVTRTFHLATYPPTNPVLKPDQPWEMATVSKDHPAPTAMVFSDGVWYDPQDQLFKMWYMGGYVQSTCYAWSRDGLRWNKPLLDVKANTNIVLDKPRDSATLWLDLEETDPAKRYKLFMICRDEEDWIGHWYVSADGIHWGESVAQDKTTGDRTTMFYNSFRKKWVFSIRCNAPGMGRARSYREQDQIPSGSNLADAGEFLWVGADQDDPMRADLKIAPQLYNLDAVAYESLLLGFFTIWPGQPKDRAKPNYVCLGFSRDGFHWDRPDHRPFINVSEKYGDWNWGNVQSAGGGCLIVGDQLYFYVSGRAGVLGSPASGACATGLACLRRDGFASMDAGKTEGTLTTRLVRFNGSYLFVNSNSYKGKLFVEVLDAQGHVLEPFSKANCIPIDRDRTLQKVVWKGQDDLSSLRGQAVKFRFYLRNSRLYSFWLSPDRTGASNGYVAAGGPGFVGPTDTVGATGYQAAKELNQR